MFEHLSTFDQKISLLICNLKTCYILYGKGRLPPMLSAYMSRHRSIINCCCSVNSFHTNTLSIVSEPTVHVIITAVFVLQTHPREIDSNGSTILIIECRNHLVTKLIYPDLLLTAAYLWGLYIFRYGEPEHLVVIMETVFLSYSTNQQLKNNQKWIVRTLR